MFDSFDPGEGGHLSWENEFHVSNKFIHGEVDESKVPHKPVVLFGYLFVLLEPWGDVVFPLVALEF